MPRLGVGTNRWGADGKGADTVAPVFSAALDLGVGLIDTAEMYQWGKSEQVIGECRRRDPRPAVVISKFTPWPTRFSVKSLPRALDASLERLGSKSIDLYMIHFPFTVLSIPALLDLLAEAVRAGKIGAIGVSNFNAKRTTDAARALERHGLKLAANEVHFSAWHRAPEQNGVLDACRAIDCKLIAYYPLAKSKRRSGPVDQALGRVAAARGKTVAQVALNWLLRRDPRVIAIPGATSVGHLRENADALSWTLTDEELAAIDRA
jgi:aryl-alcohol dehydrogenase-like predicted oxidoreductase